MVDHGRRTDLGYGIFAVDTEYVRPLMDASHLIVEQGRAAFVDTGVNSSVALLLEALQAADVDAADVDYVFLTHVHLDHAGGAGRLMKQLPNARAVLHPRGAPHMVDPGKLIKGSEAVYGKARFQEIYGRIESIPEHRIIVASDGDELTLSDRPLRCLFTEGHARHHYCLFDPASEGVFTGDSFGLSYRDFDTAKGPFIFPTTTPVHFDPVEAHRSIDRIMSLDPSRLYLTHYSLVTDVPRLAEDMHQGLDDFVAIAERHEKDPDRSVAMHTSLYGYLKERLAAHGFHGPERQLHALLDGDVELNVMGLEHWLDHRNRR